jgi:hypothetical protein
VMAVDQFRDHVADLIARKTLGLGLE